MPAKAFCDICDNEIEGEANVKMIVAGGIGYLGEDLALSMICPGCYSDVIEVVKGRVQEIVEATNGDNVVELTPAPDAELH